MLSSMHASRALCSPVRRRAAPPSAMHQITRSEFCLTALIINAVCRPSTPPQACGALGLTVTAQDVEQGSADDTRRRADELAVKARAQGASGKGEVCGAARSLRAESAVGGRVAELSVPHPRAQVGLVHQFAGRGHRAFQPAYLEFWSALVREVRCSMRPLHGSPSRTCLGCAVEERGFVGAAGARGACAAVGAQPCCSWRPVLPSAPPMERFEQRRRCGAGRTERSVVRPVPYG